MTTGARDFKGPLGGLLAANVFEIHREVLRLAEQLIGVDLQAGDAVAGVNEMNDFQQRFNRVNLNVTNHGGFASVDLGHDQAFYLRSTSLDRDRQSATHSSHPSVERKLADKQRVGDLLLVQPAVCAEDAERHGQVEAGAFLADVGRR